MTSKHLRIDGRIDIESWRAAAENLAHLGTEPAGIEFTPVAVGGVQAISATPHNATGVFQWVHGGYAICSAESHRRITGHLSAHSGMRGLSVDYRRPPENPFPAAVDDIVAVHQHLLTENEPGAIGLVADSGGASIAGAALTRMRQLDLPLPAATAWFSPWVDMTLSGPSITSNAESDLFVSRSGLSHLAALVAADRPLDDPLLSPLFANMTDWPPMLIRVAEPEILADDGRRLAEAATTAGVEVELRSVADMQHGFYFAAGNLREADDALAKAGKFLAARRGEV